MRLGMSRMESATLTSTSKRSFPKQHLVQSTEINDRFQCTFRNFAFVRDGHSGAVGAREFAAHDNVTARLAVTHKPVVVEDLANFRSRQWPKLRHAPAQ